jgi:hypothetical protein
MAPHMRIKQEQKEKRWKSGESKSLYWSNQHTLGMQHNCSSVHTVPIPSSHSHPMLLLTNTSPPTYSSQPLPINLPYIQHPGPLARRKPLITHIRRVIHQIMYRIQPAIPRRSIRLHPNTIIPRRHATIRTRFLPHRTAICS